MKCPRCDSILKSIEYDGVQIEVCSDCEGEWLHSGELQNIVEHHEEIFTPGEIASIDAVNKEIFAPIVKTCGWSTLIMATRVGSSCTSVPNAAAFGQTKTNWKEWRCWSKDGRNTSIKIQRNMVLF